jgi:hypothetical protein
MTPTIRWHCSSIKHSPTASTPSNAVLRFCWLPFSGPEGAVSREATTDPAGEGRRAVGGIRPAGTRILCAELSGSARSASADQVLGAGSLGFFDIPGNRLEQLVSKLRHRPGGRQFVADLR